MRAVAKAECDRTIQSATDLLARAFGGGNETAAWALAAQARSAIDRTMETQKDTLCVSEKVALSALRERIAKFLGTLKLPGMKLMPVSAGSFRRGSAEVRISREYRIGETEVTQAQWQAIMGNNPSNFKGGNLPVEMVSWDDAVSFCVKLTERERAAGRLPRGYVYRLPTEAEWEYAALGGNQSRGYAYSGSGSSAEVAWFDDNSGDKTHPVGQKKPNELGLYDMSGNVWEWCHDWGGHYPSGSVVDPCGAPSGSFHVYRGGGYSNFRHRIDSRYSFAPTVGEDLGFRVVLAHPVQ